MLVENKTLKLIFTILQTKKILEKLFLNTLIK